MTLLDLFIAPAYAQTAAQPPNMVTTLLLPVAFIAIMYFLMIRPQMKRAKEHKAMVSGLSVGDEVIVGGGIAGTIRALGDSFVTVEIASGVQVRVQRGAIANVLPKGTLKSA
ncbi:MAG: preprotein translocase subunit YajC [Pseudoxanthomonas suwonensis]|nr:MAG: preprotein translocase subunit YajC [Pseudoxanthomonas suwonensis]